MILPRKYLYLVVAIMLLVAKEDIDGLRVRDRHEDETLQSYTGAMS